MSPSDTKTSNFSVLILNPSLIKLLAIFVLFPTAPQILLIMQYHLQKLAPMTSVSVSMMMMNRNELKADPLVQSYFIFKFFYLHSLSKL